MIVPGETVETARLLVVSRESSLLDPLWSISESNSWQLEAVASGWDAIESIQSGNTPNLILLDLPRGDRDCQRVIRSLRRVHPNLPVILLCFPEDADRNAEGIQLGTHEILTKPLDDARLERTIRRSLASPECEKEQIASQEIEQIGPDSCFVSASPVSHKLRTQVQVLSEAEVPVLILGEAGTGKDTVARLIHKLSIRSEFEFLKVNCADMPAELLEAELFGNNFSADGRNAKFGRANNGTIFLDEITEMPLSVQSRLLQVLQNTVVLKKDVSNNDAQVNFRLLAATSANIDRALSEGRLREDLYCKLSAFTIQVPPLRQRRNEIAVLAQHLMHRLSRQYGLAPRSFSTDVLNTCRNYSWPGNLKELESFVKRYLVVGNKDLAFGGIRTELTKTHEVRDSIEKDLLPASRSKSFASFAHEIDGGSSKPKSLKSLVNSVKSEAEKNAIEIALQKTGWNRKAAARLLQVSYRTLLYKIDQYHMSAPQSYVGGLPHNGTNGAGKELK
jgi:two-component system, NtrC family, response regulator AtoC